MVISSFIMYVIYNQRFRIICGRAICAESPQNESGGKPVRLAHWWSCEGPAHAHNLSRFLCDSHTCLPSPYSRLYYMLFTGYILAGGLKWNFSRGRDAKPGQPRASAPTSTSEREGNPGCTAIGIQLLSFTLPLFLLPSPPIPLSLPLVSFSSFWGLAGAA